MAGVKDARRHGTAFNRRDKLGQLTPNTHKKKGKRGGGWDEQRIETTTTTTLTAIRRRCAKSPCRGRRGCIWAKRSTIAMASAWSRHPIPGQAAGKTARQASPPPETAVRSLCYCDWPVMVAAATPHPNPGRSPPPTTCLPHLHPSTCRQSISPFHPRPFSTLSN